MSEIRLLLRHVRQTTSHILYKSIQGGGISNGERSLMLNLYAVKVWHSSGPRHFETIEVRTYTARRAEDLANESFPGCLAAAQRIFDLMQCNAPSSRFFRPNTRAQ